MSTAERKKPKQQERGVDLEFIGSREENAESRTIASRERLRQQMSGEIEAFLNKGGKISQIDRHVTADPPQKPSSNYGERPI